MYECHTSYIYLKNSILALGYHLSDLCLNVLCLITVMVFMSCDLTYKLNRTILILLQACYDQQLMPKPSVAFDFVLKFDANLS